MRAVLTVDGVSGPSKGHVRAAFLSCKRIHRVQTSHEHSTEQFLHLQTVHASRGTRRRTLGGQNFSGQDSPIWPGRGGQFATGLKCTMHSINMHLCQLIKWTGLVEAIKCEARRDGRNICRETPNQSWRPGFSGQDNHHGGPKAQWLSAKIERSAQFSRAADRKWYIHRMKICS